MAWKSLEPFANGFESFVTSAMNMDKKTMNKAQCNMANLALLYAPRDENFESMCDAYHEHYQCDCTDPEKYNFEDKDLCSWFESSKTSFLVNNEDGNDPGKCLEALACDSPPSAECTKWDEETPPRWTTDRQPSTSTKSRWGTFAAIAFGIIIFCTLFVKCLRS